MIWGRALAIFRDHALASSATAGDPVERKQAICCRSDAIRIYMLKRAEGICEDCGRLAPFTMIAGRPYLELYQMEIINFDDLVKSPQIDFSIILMEMGIQSFQYIGRTWFPACAGKTTFYEFINFGSKKKQVIEANNFPLDNP